MPGAYEKVMWSDRFKQMRESVKYGRVLLETEQYSSLLLHHIPLLLHDVIPTKAALEDFCYADGLAFLCDVLISKARGKFRISVLPILQKLALLLCKEHATYDEDIGDVPLLVYFLTERHKYYVDINWMSHELSLMERFCKALLALLSRPADEYDSTASATSAIGINTLYLTLLAFPPHRVVARMAECFHAEGWSHVLGAVRNAASFWNTTKGCCRLLQIINSIVSFGLGWPLQRELSQYELQWSLVNRVGLNISNETNYYSTELTNLRGNRQQIACCILNRCPCNQCELRRHLRKVAKNRDEFGVIEAVVAKKQIVRSFVEAGGLSVICDIVDEINLKAKQNAKINSLKISPEDSNNFKDKDDLADADDYLYWREIAKECAGCTILMCSWDYEELNIRQNALSNSNYRPLISLLSALDLSDSRSIFNPENCVFQYGSGSILQTTSALILRSDETESRIALLKRTSLTIEVVFRRLANAFIQCCGDHGSAFTFQKGACLHLLVALLLQLCLEGRHKHRSSKDIKQLCNRSEACTNGSFSKYSSNQISYHRSNSSEEEIVQEYIHINKNNFAVAVVACQSFYDGIQNVMSEKETDRLAYFTSLLLLMAILLGIIDYNCIPDNRKRFAKPPSILCGWMTAAARDIYDLYRKSTRADECILIKELSSLVITRAEKASAMVPVNDVNLPSLLIDALQPNEQLESVNILKAIEG